MSKMKKGVRLERISKIYQDPKSGKDFYAVKDTSLTIEPGSFVTLLGPSGCGKTTTLRMIAGFESPDEGEIYLGEEAINALTPNKRDTAMVFQSYALLPHYNVFDNVAYGLKLRKVPKEEIHSRVMRILDLVELTGMEGRMTNQLSGGQQQRVALARALVIEPSVLLFDEPLSNLDAKLRVDMRSELKRLHHETGTTIIYVTHDQVEALTMSTRIALYRKGELVQVAPPLELYHNPCNLYTADFIGNPSINFIKGTAKVDAAGMTVDSPIGQQNFDRAHMTPEAPKGGTVDVTLGLRPEQVSISKEQDSEHRVEAHVYSGMPAGSETLVTVRVGKELVTVKELGSTHYGSDEKVFLGFRPEKLNVFDTASENLIKYCV